MLSQGSIPTTTPSLHIQEGKMDQMVHITVVHLPAVLWQGKYKSHRLAGQMIDQISKSLNYLIQEPNQYPWNHHLKWTQQDLH